MTATTSSKRLSYYIIPGFLGGKLHSHALRRELHSRGFIAVSSPESADIVVTHSGGAYYLTQVVLKPKLILMAAPALPRKNPKPTYKEANKQIWKTARAQKYLSKRMLWSVYSAGYALLQPRRNWHILRAASYDDLEMPQFSDSQVLFIANQNDPWPQGPQLPGLLESRPWAFTSLPGSHEQIWEHPEQYAEILEQYAKRLLA